MNQANDFKLDVSDRNFLEFFGALIGDGWLGVYRCKDKETWTIGMSGHSKDDKEYLLRIRTIIKKTFNRKATLKYKKDCNGMEINFAHKNLVMFLNKNFSFPIGKKENLSLPEFIINDWNKFKYVVRGIFDTDGSLYFDNKNTKFLYPVIDITMMEPILIDQLTKKLCENGFRAIKNSDHRIKIKGKEQMKKWFIEFRPKNNKHINKYKFWKSVNGLRAPVAQLGLELRRKAMTCRT